jgi:hypothetical protein
MGQIWSDFETIYLVMSNKALIFLKRAINNCTSYISVTSGKNQIHKSQFADIYCSCASPRARTKKKFEACLQEKFNHGKIKN